MKKINNEEFPTISVIIATYNSEKTLDRCLKSIRSQEYPQEKVTIILVDGGSQDSTFAIAEKYIVEILKSPPDKQNAEYNKGIGVRHATGELLLMIDHDNVLPHAQWIKKMVQPLLEDKEIIAVEPLRYHYDPRLSLLDRYFALFGIGDPLAYYLGKSDHLSYISTTYDLFGKAEDVGGYYKVAFSPNEIPTLGANGFLIRRKILVENAKIDEEHFFHIDVNVDLIKKGFNTYAFIKDDIIHLTGYKTVTNFLYRRKLYMEQFHIKTKKKRRYSIYMPPRDTFKLIIFILYATTFFKPIIDSIRGYIKIPDIAWFLHPFLCFTLFLIYTIVTVKAAFVKNER